MRLQWPRNRQKGGRPGRVGSAPFAGASRCQVEVTFTSGSCYDPKEHMRDVIVNRVYELRTQSGITQEVLAARVGVTRQTIIAIEKGNYTPSLLLALKLARFFKISVEDIFHFTYGT